MKLSRFSVASFVLISVLVVVFAYLWGRTADHPTTHYHVNVFMYRS